MPSPQSWTCEPIPLPTPHQCGYREHAVAYHRSLVPGDQILHLRPPPLLGTIRVRCGAPSPVPWHFHGEINSTAHRPQGVGQNFQLEQLKKLTTRQVGGRLDYTPNVEDAAASPPSSEGPSQCPTFRPAPRPPPASPHQHATGNMKGNMTEPTALFYVLTH